MSSRDSDTELVEIYVELLNEGTYVLRPTQGEPLGQGLFKLLPTPDYCKDVEEWEFLPGSIIKCAKQNIGGNPALVADFLVT